MFKRIFIGMLIFSLFFITVVAQEQDVYQLVLRYDKGIITQESLSVTKGFFQEVKLQPETGYRIELLSFDEEILYEQKFNFPLEVVFAPLPEWFDEQGNQIYFPTEEETMQILETATIELIFPYFNNGKTINVHDKDNIKVLEIDVGYFTKVCGDNICQAHENYADCSKDCPSGQKDDYCDKVEEGICDPDCVTGDIDCEEKERGKGIVEMILNWFKNIFS